jgi:hypothetical protein
MNAGDDVVETVENVVRIIERAVGQDIALGSLEDPKGAAEGLIEGVDFVPLSANAFDTQTARVSGRAMPR